MARLPQPPETAALRSLLRPAEDIVTLPRSTRLVRIFAEGGRHVQHWNTFRRVGPLPHARFDPHPVPDSGRAAYSRGNGSLYFGLTARTCVAEVFQTTSVVDRRTRRPHLTVLRPRRALRLLDL